MQGYIELVLLCLELSGEALLQSLEVLVLLLEIQLYGLCLLACVCVLLYFLLEVRGSCLQGLSLLLYRSLDILAFLCQYLLLVFAELVLCHDRVNLDVCYLELCRHSRL